MQGKAKPTPADKQFLAQGSGAGVFDAVTAGEVVEGGVRVAGDAGEVVVVLGWFFYSS